MCDIGSLRDESLEGRQGIVCGGLRGGWTGVLALLLGEWVWEVWQQAFVDKGHERVDGVFGEEGEG